MAFTFKELPIKDRVSYILCVLSFIAGTSLTFIGMFIDPVGEIHSTVLTSLGVFLSFSGAIIGISTHYSTELTNFTTEVQRTIYEKQNSNDISDDVSSKTEQ